MRRRGIGNGTEPMSSEGTSLPPPSTSREGEGSAAPEKDRPTDALLTSLLHYRRRTFRFAALLVASVYLIDLYQPRFAEEAVVRGLWILAILPASSWQRPDRPRLATLAAYLGSVLTAFAVVAIVALDGGTSSIYAGMLIATPFTVLVAMAELPWAAG